MSELKITMKRSTIGSKPKARAAMKALGLKKIGQSVVHKDTPSLRGQLRPVAHMVEVEEVEESGENQEDA